MTVVNDLRVFKQLEPAPIDLGEDVCFGIKDRLPLLDRLRADYLQHHRPPLVADLDVGVIGSIVPFRRVE